MFTNETCSIIYVSIVENYIYVYHITFTSNIRISNNDTVDKLHKSRGLIEQNNQSIVKF